MNEEWEARRESIAVEMNARDNTLGHLKQKRAHILSAIKAMEVFGDDLLQVVLDFDVVHLTVKNTPQSRPIIKEKLMKQIDTTDKLITQTKTERDFLYNEAVSMDEQRLKQEAGALGEEACKAEQAHQEGLT